MRATGTDHVCGAPLVIDADGGRPRCAVCTAQDTTWDATTRPAAPTRSHALFHDLVLEVDAMSYLERQARRRQKQGRLAAAGSDVG